MNFHDSEKMAGILSKQGFKETPEQGEADVIIFNTCSIREKAEQKFLSELGRLKKLKRIRPELKIAVAGCIAQQMGGELFKKAPMVDYLIGPQNIDKIKEVLLKEDRAAILEENPALAKEELPALRKDKPRAWVSIMFGCNNFCSYCIVPYTRGREVSRPSASIVREVQALASEGFKEVTLLGQNVNSYFNDTGFTGLLRKLHDINGLERIRFVTSHPRDLSDELMDTMAEFSGQKLCEHIHLPLQSGSDTVLRSMNRRYAYSQYLEKVRKLKDKIPQLAITTDIIAGFPGESEIDHQKTLSALNEIRYDGIFAFKYSPRPGTRASDFDRQIPEKTKNQRLTEILQLQDEITSEKNKALEGTFQQVLVEGLSEHNGANPLDSEEKQLTGRTRTNKAVNFEGPLSLTGEIVTVRIIEGKRHSLKAELV